MSEAELRDAVIAERRRLGFLSGRAAAEAAKARGATISYTTWNDWENGTRRLGPAMIKAVMVLFGWPPDWPDDPPTPSETPDGPPGGWAPLEQVVRLQEHVDSLTARVQELGAEVVRLRRQADRGAR